MLKLVKAARVQTYAPHHTSRKAELLCLCTLVILRVLPKDLCQKMFGKHCMTDILRFRSERHPLIVGLEVFRSASESFTASLKRSDGEKQLYRFTPPVPISWFGCRPPQKALNPGTAIDIDRQARDLFGRHNGRTMDCLTAR